MTATEAVDGTTRIAPGARVRARPTRYVIDLALPDFAPRDLTVEVTGRRIVVRGAHNDAARGTFGFAERVEETVELPDDARPDEIRAEYVDGTLELCVPRRRPRPRMVRVERRQRLINPTAEPC